MALHNDLTNGNVRSHIIRFAIPLIISNLFQALYNAVDMFFVGRFTGTAGLSAVSVSGPIMNIMILTVSGLSVGVSVVIANLVGHERFKEVDECANTAIALYGFLAALVTALGYFLTPQILILVQTPPEAMPQAIAYLRVIFLGTVFTFGYNLIGAFQRGFGDSKSSMMFVVTAGLCNIILDYIFVCAMGMGAYGAALATVISQAVSLTMGIVYFRINKHVITFDLRRVRVFRNHLKQLLELGVPAAGHQLLLTLSLTTLSGIANSFGLAASAAYGIGVKIDSFALLPSDAINMSMTSFTSQNIGAGKPKRAKQGLREAIILATLVACVLMVMILSFASNLAALFNDDPEVIQKTVLYLRVSCWAYLTFAVCHPLVGFLRGSGNSMQTLINIIFSQYLVRIPISYLFARWIGFPGVAVGFFISPMFSFFMYGIFIKSGRWKKSKEYQEMLASHAVIDE